MIRLWNWIMLKYWERKLKRIDWEAVQCNGCGEFVGSMQGERLIDCKCERMVDWYASMVMIYDTACDGCAWCDENERRNG